MYTTYIDLDKFDQEKFYKLVNFIKNIKDSIDLDNDDHLRGARYGDNSKIASTLLTKILCEESNKNYQVANEKFVNLSEKALLAYVSEGVRYAASCDYHYAFEKDYGDYE